jgi:hypothetical protein
MALWKVSERGGKLGKSSWQCVSRLRLQLRVCATCTVVNFQCSNTPNNTSSMSPIVVRQITAVAMIDIICYAIRL